MLAKVPYNDSMVDRALGWSQSNASIHNSMKESYSTDLGYSRCCRLEALISNSIIDFERGRDDNVRLYFRCLHSNEIASKTHEFTTDT